MKNLSVNQTLAVKKNLFVKLLLLPLVLFSIGVGNAWGETYTMYNGSSLNSSWTRSNTTRATLVTYASQYSVQLMGENSGNYGEVYSNITFTGISAISINATASNNRTLTVYYKTTAANAEWTQLSTKDISKNSNSYSNYDITITGIPSSAVYIKFRSGGNSIYIRTVTITTGSTKTLHFLTHKSACSFFESI